MSDGTSYWGLLFYLLMFLVGIPAIIKEYHAPDSTTWLKLRPKGLCLVLILTLAGVAGFRKELESIGDQQELKSVNQELLSDTSKLRQQLAQEIKLLEAARENSLKIQKILTKEREERLVAAMIADEKTQEITGQLRDSTAWQHKSSQQVQDLTQELVRMGLANSELQKQVTQLSLNAASGKESLIDIQKKAEMLLKEQNQEYPREVAVFVFHPSARIVPLPNQKSDIFVQVTLANRQYVLQCEPGTHWEAGVHTNAEFPVAIVLDATTLPNTLKKSRVTVLNAGSLQFDGERKNYMDLAYPSVPVPRYLVTP